MFKKLLALLIITFLLTSCQKEIQMIENSNLAFGTVTSIKLYNTENNELISGANNILNLIENEMSTKIETSKLNEINSANINSPITISDDLHYVIEKGLYYSKLSNGNFNIAILPLVNLWAIGTENEKIPKDKEIKNTMSKLSFQNIQLNKNSILVEEKTKLDLGGIAKGYAADKIKEYFKKNNISKGIINIGGNILTIGSSPSNEPWKVGIKDPIHKNTSTIGYIEVIDKSVVTSGIYERFFIKNNKRYHHILNPESGYPVENELYSVSIISNHSIDGDALSTIAFSYGLKKGIKFINSLENTEAIFITKNKEIFLSDNISGKFKLTNPKFKIKKVIK